MGGEGDLEETARLIEHAFPEQRPPDLEHQVVVAFETEGEDMLEACDGGAALAELEQHFAEAGERVLVIGVETARFFERAPRPRELFPREPRIAHPHVQFDGMGIQPQALAQGVYGVVVLSFVVELMCTFVVFVGTEERIRHRTGPSGKVVL